MTVVARAVVARATALMIEASPGLEALSSFQMPLPRRGRRCSPAAKVGKEMPPSMPWLSTASAGSEAACSTRGERGLMMATRRSVNPREPRRGLLARVSVGVVGYAACVGVYVPQALASEERPAPSPRMGAQAKKKGPVKGGKGGRKANKQAGETAPSWALEQLALEQNAAAAEGESAPLPTPDGVEAASPEALAALLAQCGRADLELAKLALARAARLTMQSSKRPALVRGGLAAACVAAMGAHVHALAVQRDGCASLGGAALGAAEGRAAVCAAGGAGAIVAAMHAHAEAASVQERGCWALRQLAVGGAAPQAIVLEAGGAAAVIAAMHAHADAAAVVQEGCSALGNMAGGDLPSQRKVLAEGGATAAVAALNGAHGGSAAVATQAIGALGNLAGGDDACQRGALEAGAAAAVVAALASHTDAPSVQQGGRAALANMAWGGGEMRERVLAAGAVAEWLS